MFFKKLQILFLILFISAILFQKQTFAQEDLMYHIEEIIEEIAASSDEELDYSQLYSTLETYYNDPINLNTATIEELSELIFLTEFQIYSLVNYRKKFGNYNSIYELQFVDGIDTETLKRLLPFVSVEAIKQPTKLNFAKVLTYGKHTVIARYGRQLQTKAGYKITDTTKSRYLGSPDKIYIKYGYQYKNKISFGITAEKDDGEQFFKGAQKYGFDFYSAHFQLNDIAFFKKIIIGDYSAQFGQGLTMWSGMGFGKSTGITNVIKKARGVNRYTSVNEQNFFRGEAVTMQFGKFNFTEFVSYKKLDANTNTIIYDTINGEEEELISSFLESGYHRTPSETAKIKTVGEFVSGGNLSWTSNILKLGLTGVYTKYSKSMSPNAAPYRVFDFLGNSNFNGGLDYLLTLKQFIIFGETSMSQNFGWATVNGAVFDFVPEFKMSIVQRYYSPDYQAFFALPFSAGNKPYNESGVFVGAEIYPIKKLKIDAYIDSWKYPWLRYGINGPSKGMDYVIQISHFTRRDVDMYFKFKYITKDKNYTVNDQVQIKPYSTFKYRYHINYTPSETIKLKTRIELCNYISDTINTLGYVIYQAVQYSPKKIPFTFNLLFAVFDTEDYNTRIYCYEPDVLYGFSVPAYSGKGERIVFVVKYQLTSKLNFWFRIANTYYHDKKDLGSGLDAIKGNNKTDIKLQVKYTF